jgi:hypothetical protein
MEDTGRGPPRGSATLSHIRIPANGGYSGCQRKLLPSLLRRFTRASLNSTPPHVTFSAVTFIRDSGGCQRARGAVSLAPVNDQLEATDLRDGAIGPPDALFGEVDL